MGAVFFLWVEKGGYFKKNYLFCGSCDYFYTLKPYSALAFSQMATQGASFIKVENLHHDISAQLRLEAPL